MTALTDRFPLGVTLPRPAAHTPPPVSITTDDSLLRKGECFRPYDLDLPDGRTHTLMVVHEGIEVPQLTADYDRLLRGRLRALVWAAARTPDPRLDPTGYATGAWWTRELLVSVELIIRLEQAGLLYPWPHGRTTGPLLSPSRA